MHRGSRVEGSVVRLRSNACKAVAIGALAAVLGIEGCQAPDSGVGKTRGGGTSTASGIAARASSVTVTYYYLPG
jgi:hypothetical protein